MFKRSLLALTVVFATSQVQAFSFPTFAGLRSSVSVAADSMETAGRKLFAAPVNAGKFVAGKAVVAKDAVVATAKTAGTAVAKHASALAALINTNRKSAAAIAVAAISAGYLLARGTKWAVKAYKARQANQA